MIWRITRTHTTTNQKAYPRYQRALTPMMKWAKITGREIKFSLLACPHGYRVLLFKDHTTLYLEPRCAFTGRLRWTFGPSRDFDLLKVEKQAQCKNTRTPLNWKGWRTMSQQIRRPWRKSWSDVLLEHARQQQIRRQIQRFQRARTPMMKWAKITEQRNKILSPSLSSRLSLSLVQRLHDPVLGTCMVCVYRQTKMNLWT